MVPMNMSAGSHLSRFRGGIWIISFFVFLAPLTAVAQRDASVRGKLSDGAGSELMQDAMIAAIRTSDSALVSYTVARHDASFQIDHLPFGSYFLQISFLGYKTVYRELRLSADIPFVDLGMVNMEIAVTSLDSVTVLVPPLIMKGDTLEFNAGSFKTRPFAPLEDLLRKLPGVQVGMDGVIRVNGTEMDQLLVDGKPFFNGSTNIATQNLPAEIIGKVQVYDASSNDQSAFTGFDQGIKKKTINVVIKKNRRKGNFGKGTLGAGTTGAYSAGLNVNHFNGSQQVSLIGQATNINLPLSGAPPLSASDGNTGSNGITRLLNGGINYRDSRSKNTSLYGNYLYNNVHTVNNQVIGTKTILPHDSSTFNNARLAGLTIGRDDRVNINIEQKIDESSSLVARTNLDFQRNTYSQSQQSSLTGSLLSDTLYRSNSQNNNSRDGRSVSGNILFKHRFSASSRTFSADLNFLQSTMNINGFSHTQTSHFSPQFYYAALDLHSLDNSGNFRVAPTLSFTTPVNNHQALEIAYKFTYNKSNSDNRTFFYNASSKEYDLPDSLQSDNFINKYISNKISVNYKFQSNKFNLILGTGMQTDHLAGQNQTIGRTLQEHYFSLIPVVGLVCNFSSGKSLQLNYDGSPVQLSVQQIQPVSVTKDSLYIQKGNPDLSQPYTHTLALTYTSLVPGTQHLFSAGVSSSMTVNDIQNSTTQWANGAQIVMPVNVNGSFLIAGNICYSLPVIRLRSNLNFRADIHYLQDPEILNGERNITGNSMISSTVNWTVDIPDKVSLTLNAVSAFNIINYSLQKDLNTEYFTTALFADMSCYSKNWTFSCNEYYYLNNGLPTSFKRSLPFIAPAISRKLFKGKSSELKLTVYDLLDQQTGLSRSVTPNTIQDISTSGRGRYFLLSFTYNLSRFSPGKPR